MMNPHKIYQKDASFLPLSKKQCQDLKELSGLARFLDGRGAIPATSGNFSARLDEKSFFMSISGVHKRHLDPSKFVRVNSHDGTVLSPIPVKPSDETPVHALIYRLLPEVNAIAHCHAKEFDRFSEPEHIFFGEEIIKALGALDHDTPFTLPVFANSQDMAQVAQAIQEYHERKGALQKAVLLQKHGMYCFGPSIRHVQNYLEAFLHLSA